MAALRERAAAAATRKSFMKIREIRSFDRTMKLVSSSWVKKRRKRPVSSMTQADIHKAEKEATKFTHLSKLVHIGRTPRYTCVSHIYIHIHI
jgi:hypothetical protein